MAKETIPTAGYDADGNEHLFHLEKGEKLPSGFHPKPPKGTHPHERGAVTSEPVEVVHHIRHK